jgi:hypothetical protein
VKPSGDPHETDGRYTVVIETGDYDMPIPVETVRGFDNFGVKVLVPGRSRDDLVEVWIVRPAGEKRTEVVICNGCEEVASHSVDDQS